MNIEVGKNKNRIDEDWNHTTIPLWIWIIVLIPFSVVIGFILYARLRVGIFGFKL